MVMVLCSTEHPWEVLKRHDTTRHDTTLTLIGDVREVL